MKSNPAIAATKKYYEKNGQPWLSLKTNSFYNELPFQKLIKLLPKKGAVLDIGCAAGIHVPLFLGIGRHITYEGIDISKTFIKTAKSRYPQLPFSVANIADSASLPKPKKKYIGFFAASTLQHVPFDLWDTMFGNIESIMTKGALGFISLPTEATTDKRDPDDTRHFTLMSSEEHLTYFKKRGYRVRARGVHDGYSKAGIWRWYIVQLPK
jgi:SAM-dependent methyltransferase